MTELTLERKLEIYKAHLLKWSRAVNLVASSTLNNIEVRHFQDSLQLLNHIPQSTRTLFDFGSGAGFPALPIAMALPDCVIHAFESDQKKCAFLQSVSRETSTPIVIHSKRIETVDFKELPAPDIITARALASLKDLLSYATGCWLTRPECSLLFLKGERWNQEILEAQKCYGFDIKVFPSKTNKDARVIKIKNIYLL